MISQTGSEEYLKVTASDFQAGSVSGAGAVVQQIENNSTFFIHEDFREFRRKLQDEILSYHFETDSDDSFSGPGINDVMIALPPWIADYYSIDSEYELPLPPNGAYPMLFKYKLPGLNTPTTIHTIDLIKD